VQNGFIMHSVWEEWKEITKGSGRYFNLHDKEYLHQLRMAGCDIGLERYRETMLVIGKD
jgi:hypothetical protein